jgi:uncharacterized repeat protein (TIGR03803 family)
MMRTSLLGRCARIAVAALLAGCGGSQTITPLRAVPPAEANKPASPLCTVRIIYSFTRGNGSYPNGYAPSILRFVDGKFLGITFYGGRYLDGTVFTMTLSGDIRTIYSFKGSPDGEGPDDLTIFNGKYYGTTYLGGRYGAGTVFELTPTGNERILHSFEGGRDGAQPFGGLHMLDGKFYGVTSSGGNGDLNGTVFDITPFGAERVLHRFGSRSQDYATSPGGLVILNGILYGTAGTSKHGFGTIFRLSSSGSYKNIHTFKLDEGGYGSIFVWHGAIYGVTYGQIGPNFNGSRGFHRGAFFELLRPSAHFRLIAKIGDFFNRPGRLIPLDGAFLGSLGGGAYGDGEIYKLTTSGDESVVCSFHQTLQGPRHPEDPGIGIPYRGKFYAAAGPGKQGDGGKIYEVTL